MIVEITVKGNKATTFHDFIFAQTGMSLEISAGTYTQGGAERFSSLVGATLDFVSPAATTHYELWLTDSGITVLMRTDTTEFGDVVNPIDRLAWFTIPAGAITLDSVEIHAVRMEAA